MFLLFDVIPIKNDLFCVFQKNLHLKMSVRLPKMENDFSRFRQPNVRAKVWSLEPLWKFVSYDLDLSPDVSPTGTFNDSNQDYSKLGQYFSHFMIKLAKKRPSKVLNRCFASI